MMALENASISEKYLFSNRADTPMIPNRIITREIANRGAIRLFILSVNGSAFPMPPHEPQSSPC